MNTTALLLVIAFLVGVTAAVLTGFLTWIGARNAAKALLAAGTAFTAATTATVTVMTSIGAFTAQP